MSAEDPGFEPGSDMERREALRRAWLTEHGGEAVRLESAVVAELAYRLIEAGLQPTVESIRYVNGGQGSPNVIHPAVRQFFRSELRRRWDSTPQPPVPGVPDALVELWTQCVQDAQRVAEAALEAPRADLAGLRQALAQRAAEIEATAELQRAELGAVRQQATDLAERLNQAQQAHGVALERAHAAESSLASAQVEIKAQIEAQKTLQAQAAAERATLTKERDRWRAQAEEARREVAVLAKTREDAASRLAEQLARAAAQQALEHDLRAALTAANAQIVDLRTENQRAEARGAAAAAELRTAHEAAAQATQRASVIEARLQAAEDRTKQIQADLDAARTSLLEAARCEGALHALREERDRLGAQLANLQKQLGQDMTGTKS